jgi:hypothetical protein
LLSEAVKSAKRPQALHESKALNMGIAGVEPCQLQSSVSRDSIGAWYSLYIIQATQVKGNNDDI